MIEVPFQYNGENMILEFADGTSQEDIGKYISRKYNGGIAVKTLDAKTASKLPKDLLSDRYLDTPMKYALHSLKKGALRGVSGTVGFLGDLSNLLPDAIGVPARTFLPTTESVYNRFFSPSDGYVVDPAKQTVSDMIGEYSASVLPDILTGKALAKYFPKAGKYGRQIADWLYGTSLKSPLKGAERASMLRTAVRDRVPITMGGLNKTEAVISKTGTLVDDLINSRSARVGDVSIMPIVGEMGKTSDMARSAMQSRPRKAVERYINDFLDVVDEDAMLKGRPFGTMRLDEIQRMKKGAYVLNQNNYGKDLTDFEKMLNIDKGRGARKIIEDYVPEVKPLNERLSNYIKLNEDIARATGRASNYEPVTLIQSSMMGASPTGALAVRAGMFPGVRSRIAFNIDRLSSPEIQSLLRLKALKSSGGASGEPEAMSPSAVETQAPTAPQPKILDKETAKMFLRATKGDKAKAKAMAIEQGYTIQ